MAPQDHVGPGYPTCGTGALRRTFLCRWADMIPRGEREDPLFGVLVSKAPAFVLMGLDLNTGKWRRDSPGEPRALSECVKIS